MSYLYTAFKVGHEKELSDCNSVQKMSKFKKYSNFLLCFGALNTGIMDNISRSAKLKI